MKKILLLIFITCSFALAQNVKPETLIRKVKENFAKVKDYEVDAHIHINVDFLKVPETDAKIYFKQPDKVKLSSSQFAMIPSEGLNFSPMSFFKGNYSAVFVRNENYTGFNTAVIKIVPLDDDKDIILSTVWIDMDYFIVRKTEITTKSKGTYALLLNYDVGKTKYYLPVSMTFLFDVKTDNLHGKFGNNKDTDKNGQKKKSMKGSASITYSNYKVNKGIPDSIFKDDKKK